MAAEMDGQAMVTEARLGSIGTWSKGSRRRAFRRGSHVFTLSSTPSKRWNLDGANEVSADAQFSSARPQILRH